MDGNDKKDVTGAVDIALIDDEAGLIVTTVAPGTDIDKKVTEGTITNSRTVTVDKIISTDKASVFNIKFLSQNALTYVADNILKEWTAKEKATYSEYNKYLGIKGGVFFARVLVCLLYPYRVKAAGSV